MGSPLDSALLKAAHVGQYKPPGVSLKGWVPCLVVRTVDNHLHIFNINKDSVTKSAQDIFHEVWLFSVMCLCVSCASLCIMCLSVYHVPLCV